ncbi:protein SHQ1 homolog [Leptinotarsa decemlineata]|uniref:protein SHQ1 homolog n=1 Tax=Leptinotarsa decemlineata TaxID=7539 RepID=UPI003D306580
MITPRFNLSQQDNSLIIRIRAPYCSLRDLEVDCIQNSFLFFCKPYYLRLQLPGNIVDNQNTRSSFDCDSGYFTFIYDKETPGEFFPDLEYITKFLVTKVDASYDENETEPIMVLSGEITPTEEKMINENTKQGFGFALKTHKKFATVISEFDEVFEVNPCETSLLERRKMRLQYEQGKFDMEHYLMDLEDEEHEIGDKLALPLPWEHTSDASLAFTSKELDFLKDQANNPYNLTALQIRYAFNGLIDILYAYCYDKRTTDFEGNSESGWTIVKLASTLSWCEAFEDPKDVFVSAFRRTLTYPYYRSFKLATKVFEDLKTLLKHDEKLIIKILIEIHEIFLSGDCCRYILNNLFIKDYIMYVMKWDKTKWRQFLEEVYGVVIVKDDLGLKLVENEESFKIEKKMKSLQIQDQSELLDSDDTDESDSDSSDSETDSDSETNSDYDSSTDEDAK